jgi:hypothetical protein
VTLLLPKDTVERLDFIANQALLGSRGRAVQSLVDEVLGSADSIRILMSAGLRLTRARSQQEAAALFLLALMQAGNLANRLDRFLDVKPLSDKEWERLMGAITPPVPPVVDSPKIEAPAHSQ